MINKLMPYVPQTYGEAILVYPSLKCEPHEWDNNTTLENTIYLLQWLASIQPTVNSGRP